MNEDQKPRKADGWGRSMMGKMSRTSKDNIQRSVDKRLRQRSRRMIDEELDAYDEENNIRRR